jgi:GTP-binding protein
LRITAEFVTSAATTADLPADDLPEIALVGRSNVGKSSLINALTRQRLARTSAAPGKTRLANIYRVQRGGARGLYLVDLPGYGYARGGAASARDFEELTRGYFGQAGQAGQAGRTILPAMPAGPGLPARVSALLLIDARHPGLESDREAWRWLKQTVAEAAVVATKIDKLARGERIRALRELESVVEDSVLPVSAVTGEGLDELWKLIDKLANNPNLQPLPPANRSSSHRPAARATAPHPTNRQAQDRPGQSRGASRAAGRRRSLPKR